MSTRNNTENSLSSVLKQFIKDNHLEKGMEKVEARNAWEKLMGAGVNSYTTGVELKNDTLYVSLSSSVLRDELSYGKTKIIAMLNEDLGKDVIQKLVLR